VGRSFVVGDPTTLCEPAYRLSQSDLAKLKIFLTTS